MTIGHAAKALWWVSLAFVIGGIWSSFSFYFGLTLFVIYMFRSKA